MPYSQVIHLVRCRLSFALIRSAIRAIRDHGDWDNQQSQILIGLSQKPICDFPLKFSPYILSLSLILFAFDKYGMCSVFIFYQNGQCACVPSVFFSLYYRDYTMRLSMILYRLIAAFVDTACMNLMSNTAASYPVGAGYFELWLFVNCYRLYTATAPCSSWQRGTAQNILHPLDKKLQYCSSDSCCMRLSVVCVWANGTSCRIKGEWKGRSHPFLSYLRCIVDIST